ncbi:hypothetical protein Tco_1461997, partial [Tanacetum coccineum]
IIAKVLANWLSKVIDKIVSDKQSDFISGRQILDDPLILNEVIDWFKKRKKNMLIFKVDFEKAFDSGLHCAISNAISSGLIHGIKIGSSDIMLSHLFYVDDVVITTEWNVDDLDYIIRMLHVFYLALRLNINIHISNFYGIGVSNEEVSVMASSTCCASGSLPFAYLGLPIGPNMNLISHWKILIDRFQMRLSSWKANLISIGGRLTHIKAVLGSLGIYYLLIFRAPELILKALERYHATFFGVVLTIRKLFLGLNGQISILPLTKAV